MSRPLVVVSTRSFGTGKADPQGLLEAAGCRLEPIATDHDLGVVSGTLREAVGWIAGSAPVTEAHFAAAPHLQVVARYGVGVDAVDLRAAATGGVVVANTPGAMAAAEVVRVLIEGLPAQHPVIQEAEQ